MRVSAFTATLAQADLGLAMGTGTGAAIEAADLTPGHDQPT
jgi:cation transport ATPase